MAKGKNLNPADAYRKAQRKKELKKNKAGRQKSRHLALVKKDTTEIEDEIKTLEESSADKSRLADLKAELENIHKKKEEYLSEHPEQRHLVYRKKKTEEEQVVPAQRNVFNKKGLPRRPERSIYYDPVMNPYGVPPPGMPYMERPLQPGEVDSDLGETEDDVAMPQGPPPGPFDELVESDDDIPMPEGPPPGRAVPPLATTLLPLQPFALPLHVQGATPFLPPAEFPGAILPPSPLAPPGFLPAGYPHAFPNFPPTGVSVPPLPPAPPGFFPRQSQSASSMQDPLSSVPHVTYQVHNATRSSLPSHPSLPDKPMAAVTALATISAEPQLRDLKKEATAFVPTALKRKRPATSVPSSSKVNAAPALADELKSPEDTLARPDLVSTLRDQFGVPPVAKPDTSKSTQPRKNDDYDKFLEEMGDILGSGS